ncbi:E3 ubiquitin-protein ligase listerin [Nymphaea thermarum]|nr:E3 ubiquitin-protein ligase listerin [Nymphaea thermarum]
MNLLMEQTKASYRLSQLKALSSLSVLFKQRPGEEIVKVVPQWAFDYKKLLHDYNREVRRATHNAMASLVTTVGYRIQLLVHLNDMQAAFPAKERRLEALILCEKEVFLYLDENLKLQPQFMSDKVTPVDELDEMHQRVIASSLLALAALVDMFLGMQYQRTDFEGITLEPKVTAKAREIALASAEQIFCTQKSFLEFLKSQNPGVRLAVYSVTGSYVKHMPSVYNDGNMKETASAILGSFQEKNPTCHSLMWDSVLLFTRRFPESWSTGIIHKIVFPRFWDFLRSGCYGSQRISYPVLVLFLDSIPLNVISWAKFLENFFENLWAGRNLSLTSSEDRSAFFKAIEECFLWAINNVPRFADGSNIDQFELRLVEKVLVELLWHDYIFPVYSTHPCELTYIKLGSSEKDNVQSCGKGLSDALNTKYSANYIQELGDHIVEMAAAIFSKSSRLLVTFSTAFLHDCINIIKQAELGVFPEVAERLGNFLVLLAKQNTEAAGKWPLHHFAGPLMSKSFPLIKSSDSPSTVRLLSVIVENFGSKETILKCASDNSEEFQLQCDGEGESSLNSNHFVQVFNHVFVPWCLTEIKSSTPARMDLLLALIDNEYFAEQWGSIISFLTTCQQSQSCSWILNVDCVTMLAMLVERIRYRTGRKSGTGSQLEFNMESWQHDCLDSAAVLIATDPPSAHQSYVLFLCAVLGGMAECVNFTFISKESIISVYEELLDKIVPLFMVSPFTWAIHESSLISCRKRKDMICISRPFHEILEMAKFAFQVLDGSLLCLKMLDGESELVPCILAAILLIDWECRMMASVALNGRQDDTKNQTDTNSPSTGMREKNILVAELHSMLALGESVHALHCKIDICFWESLSKFTAQKVQEILLQTVRLAVISSDDFDTEKICIVCSSWVLDIPCLMGNDEAKQQIMLDKLLLPSKSWPLWVAPQADETTRGPVLVAESPNVDVYVPVHDKFVSFVGTLISTLGAGRVLSGFMTESSVSASESSSMSPSPYTRAWLVAEMLCAWKWYGGNATSSILPFICEYAKSCPDNKLVHSVVHILLDGAVLHGARIQACTFNVWTICDDELENIHDPYLRALVSVLLALFVRSHVWGKVDAFRLLDYINDRIFVGTSVNQCCLRIIPYFMGILIRSLYADGNAFTEVNNDVPADTSKEEQVNTMILGWLGYSLSAFSVIKESEEEDVNDWIEIVISCYPLCTTVGIATFTFEAIRSIGQEEQKLLLDLFKKRRSCMDDLSTSYPAGQMPSNVCCSEEMSSSVSDVMTFCKLMAVCISYCWPEFNEEDWKFVVLQLHKWIEAAVVVMEEMTDNIDAISQSSSSDSFDMNVRKLKEAVEYWNSFPIYIARIALLVFMFIYDLTELSEAKHTETLECLYAGEWAPLRDRMLESVLRLFFTTGLAESIASSLGEEAASVVALVWHAQTYFWDLVAGVSYYSPEHVRKAAIESIGLWGLSSGPIDSLYAILFSSKPVPSLQFTAYVFLSSAPLSHLAIMKEESDSLSENVSVDKESCHSQIDLPSEKPFALREKIFCIIEKSSLQTLEEDLGLDQVNFFLAWSLLLTHLQSLPPLSLARERLVQYLQDSTNPSIILDALFQHIPLKSGSTLNLKKKETELPAEISRAAAAAKQAITSRSLLFAIKSLWPVGSIEMAALAGAIYGLLICVLPAYVRNWFTGLRDRSTLLSVESFTKSWCSLHLLSDEMSQIKGAGIADENLSISVNKLAYEITATYKKEETSMDLVIQLPSCYPLRPVDVGCSRNLGISETKQRKWLMSLTAFVRNQNGALSEAIRVWKSNFDKEFEGVEECPICYSIIHTSNHSLPRLACKTCKHKFHSACLYKWFSTSHKSTCPLCQSPF